MTSRRFNLGIAHTNLAQYGLAAQNIIDAIRLQQAEATEAYSTADSARPGVKGVTSEILWTSLRNACMQ